MISTISAMTIASWWCLGSGASRAVPAKALDNSNTAIGRHVCTPHHQHPHIHHLRYAPKRLNDQSAKTQTAPGEAWAPFGKLGNLAYRDMCMYQRCHGALLEACLSANART